MAKVKDPPGITTEPGKTLDGLSFLTNQTIGMLDNGLVGAVIDEAIRQAAHDTEMRGHLDEKARKVVITVSMTKLNEHDVKVECQVDTKVPPLRADPTFAQTRREKQTGPYSVAFRVDNPDRPDQPTIPFPNESESA